MGDLTVSGQKHPNNSFYKVNVQYFVFTINAVIVTM